MGNNKKGNAAAGIAGAVIGAGIVVAATALSDKKTRAKVMSTVSDVKDQVMDMAKNVSKQKGVNDAKKTATTIARKSLSAAKKKMATVAN